MAAPATARPRPAPTSTSDSALPTPQRSTASIPAETTGTRIAAMPPGRKSRPGSPRPSAGFVSARWSPDRPQPRRVRTFNKAARCRRQACIAGHRQCPASMKGRYCMQLVPYTPAHLHRLALQPHQQYLCPSCARTVGPRRWSSPAPAGQRWSVKNRSPAPDSTNVGRAAPSPGPSLRGSRSPHACA